MARITPRLNSPYGWALVAGVLMLHLGLLQTASEGLHLHPAEALPETLFDTRLLSADVGHAPTAASKPVRARSAPKTRPASPTLAPAQAQTADSGHAPALAATEAPPATTPDVPEPPQPPASAPLPEPSQAAASRTPPVPAATPAADPVFASAPAATDPAATADLAAASASMPASSVSASATPPLRFSAETLAGAALLRYQVTSNKFPYRLSGELLWQPLADGYQLSLTFSALGQSRSQTSRGSITTSGLTPLRFSDKYRSEVAAHFDWEHARVTFSANTPDAVLLPGAQDRLSVVVQLGALIASQPSRFPAGTALTVQTVGPRGADLWPFEVQSLEQVDLPGGPLSAIKLVRQPRQLYDQRVELWLAPSLGYLPARVRLTEANGDTLDQQWLSREPAPAQQSPSDLETGPDVAK